MKATSRAIRKKYIRSAEIVGIVEDAKILEVCRDHLRLVLQGKRPSARLLVAYQSLKASQAAKSK